MCVKLDESESDTTERKVFQKISKTMQVKRKGEKKKKL